jgi:hypothetical protein
MANYDNIPTELRKPALWLQYYLSPDPKKPGKKPRKHPCVKYATQQDRAANLRGLDYLLGNRPPQKGVQRYVEKSEGFTYIDLDHVRNQETGEILPWVSDLIAWLDTYTEISASGTGFHLVARGTLPEDFKLDPNPIEIYSGNIPNKLIAMTGDLYDEWRFSTIENRQEKLDKLLGRAKAGEFGTPATGATESQISGETFDTIKEKALEWLWKNRIPKNKITIFGGNPDAGKSLVSLDLTARLTTNRDWPDGEKNGVGTIEVALLFCEDDAADTVKPRLLVAGADCAKVHRLFSTFVSKDGTKKDRQIAFDTDLQKLERFLLEHRAIRFLVIDPISNYLGEASMVKETDVRRVLVPLAELAAALEVTILLIAHLNKRSDVSALHKIMGAVAISGVARAAWMFAEDPENEGSYLMVRGKLNVGKKTEGLRYTITAKGIPDCGEQPFINWNGTTDVSAGQVFGLFGPVETDKKDKTTDATTWLKGFLSAGDKTADEVLDAATREDIKERTLRRAKSKLGVLSVQHADGWRWQLPSGDSGCQTSDGFM